MRSGPALLVPRAIGARQIICTFFGKREVLTASFMQRPDKGPGHSQE